MIERMLKDDFLKGVNGRLKKEILCFIHDGYSKRITLNMSQEQYAKHTGLTLSTLKRIELGKCYDLKFISLYACS